MTYSNLRGDDLSLDALTGRVAIPARTTFLALMLGAIPKDLTNMANLPEVTTAGYARQPVGWTAPATPVEGGPRRTVNNALISFGPFTASMTQDVVWAVLVSTATGVTGEILFSWKLEPPAFAQINETIQIAPGQIGMDSA